MSLFLLLEEIDSAQKSFVLRVQLRMQILIVLGEKLNLVIKTFYPVKSVQKSILDLNLQLSHFLNFLILQLKILLEFLSLVESLLVELML